MDNTTAVTYGSGADHDVGPEEPGQHLVSLCSLSPEHPGRFPVPYSAGQQQMVPPCGDIQMGDVLGSQSQSRPVRIPLQLQTQEVLYLGTSEEHMPFLQSHSILRFLQKLCAEAVKIVAIAPYLPKGHGYPC